MATQVQPTPPHDAFERVPQHLSRVLEYLDPIEAGRASSVCHLWNQTLQEPQSQRSKALSNLADWKTIFAQQPRETTFVSPDPTYISSFVYETTSYIAWKSRNLQGQLFINFRDKATLKDTGSIEITEYPNYFKSGDFAIFCPHEGVGPILVVDPQSKTVYKKIDLNRDPQKNIVAVFATKIGQEIIIAVDDGSWMRWNPATNQVSATLSCLPEGKCKIKQVVRDDTHGNFLFFRGTLEGDIPFLRYVHVNDPANSNWIPCDSQYPIAIHSSILFVISDRALVAMKVKPDKVQTSPLHFKYDFQATITGIHLPRLDWTELQATNNKVCFPTVRFPIVNGDINAYSCELWTTTLDCGTGRLKKRLRTNTLIPTIKKIVSRVRLFEDTQIWLKPTQIHAMDAVTNQAIGSRNVNGTIKDCSCLTQNGKPHSISVAFRQTNGASKLWLFDRTNPQTIPTPPPRTLSGRMITWFRTNRLLQRIGELIKKIFCCRRTRT